MGRESVVGKVHLSLLTAAAGTTGVPMTITPWPDGPPPSDISTDLSLGPSKEACATFAAGIELIASNRRALSDWEGEGGHRGQILSLDTALLRQLGLPIGHQSPLLDVQEDMANPPSWVTVPHNVASWYQAKRIRLTLLHALENGSSN
jgi:hypothetical protein